VDALNARAMAGDLSILIDRVREAYLRLADEAVRQALEGALIGLTGASSSRPETPPWETREAPSRGPVEFGDAVSELEALVWGEGTKAEPPPDVRSAVSGISL
jgi:hypothetical protein